MRDVAPILELRTPFALARSELDAVDRGSKSPDLSRLVDAARKAALAEDGAVFYGFGPARIDGIASSSPHAPIPLDADYEEFPVPSPERWRCCGRGRRWPVRPRSRTPLLRGCDRDHAKGWLPGARAASVDHGRTDRGAQAVDGSVVVSLRGGDFELTLGEDFAIGFATADAELVQLYLEESLAFRAHSPEAAVALEHQT